jgi:AcrR family transcriptional regulator
MEDQQFQPISSPTAVKIVDAAGHLFMQRGYKAVSINDIIRAADVTKPTLYYYFADKEELFVQMGLRVLAEMGDRLDHAAALTGDTATRLSAMARVLMANSETDMRMMRHEMFEHLNDANRQRLAQAFFGRLVAPVQRVMERAVVEGELVGHSPQTLTKIFISMAEALQEYTAPDADEWPVQGQQQFADEPISSTTLVAVFMHGVGAPARA